MNPPSIAGRIGAPLALVLAVFALYAQTAGHAFVGYDAGPYLFDNPHVRGGLSLAGVRWALTGFAASNWHPLTWISHMLDVELFGLAPAGPLLENAAWHALNALLVLALFTRLGLARPFAFAGALLFAIHPLRVETVAWFVERKELLSTCFGLATLLAWLSWSRERVAWKLAAALALYACSLASKGMLVTLPCLLVLLEFTFLGRTSARPRRSDLATLAFALLALGTCLLTLAAQSTDGAIQGLDTHPLAARLANTLDAYAWYLGHTFWPGSLACFYPWNGAALPAGRLLLEALLLAGVSTAAWSLRRRVPGLWFGWLWFLGTLVPVIGLVQVGAQAHADRYSYVPALGLVFGLCELTQLEFAPRIGNRLLATAWALAALALGLQTFRQVATWQDTETLGKHALEVTGPTLVACDLLGNFYDRAGREAEALPFLRMAVKLAPRDPIAISNLGATLVRTGNYLEAEPLLAQASVLTPQRWQAWSLLGAARLGNQHPASALAAFDNALQLEPQDPGTWTNRERAFAALLDTGPPVQLAAEAWKLASASQGPLARPADALRLAEQAVRRGGEQPALLDALAFALAASGEFADAAATLERALAIGRAADPAWAARAEKRLAAYRAGRIDRETPR